MTDRNDPSALPSEVRFIVPGTALGAGTRSGGGAMPASEHGEVTQAVRVGARRSGGGDITMTAVPGKDVVEIVIANGPTLVLHPQDALELLRAQQGGVPAVGRDGRAPAVDEVVVASQLAWRGLDGEADGVARGGLLPAIGGVVLDAVRVVRRKLVGEAATWTAAEIGQRVDSQVDAGVYALSANALGPLKGRTPVRDFIRTAADGATLVLIHGTFSSTAGTFAKLWSVHPTRVKTLFERYDGRVYALDHPTLTAGPFANALTLLQRVPDNAQLHLLTHSRGGLVAEIVARVVNGQGLDEAALRPFAGPGFEQHRRDLKALENHAGRGIRVTRVVRVACPARGTLLASRRLDAYVSVLRWALELAGLHVLPALVEFLGAVAERRLRPDELPGLQAMVPDSATTQWLTQPTDRPLVGELRVVAGDIQGDTVLSWLKTLLTDAFYWTDHDLVVQTRSMYGGAPRGEGGASFVLDRGAKVSHFRYFENELTAAAIVDGLLAKTPPAGYRAIGPLSWSGESASGDRAAARGADPSLPAVFVLPGILGSHLKVAGRRIWLSWRFLNNLEGIAYPDAAASPDGPIGATYDDLIAHLRRTHDVRQFSFDWRRPIEEEAVRLADEVDEAIKLRRSSGQPVRIVAHSMGGLVARTMQLERPGVWDAMFQHPGARLLMLGTPNGGSYAPMQVLSGDDTFGNLLSMSGSLFDGHAARQLIAGMPGLLQLQADLLDERLGLGRPDGWAALQKADVDAVQRRIDALSWWHRDLLQQKPLLWGLPDGKTLARAVALRRRLDQQGQELPNADQVVLVVGRADFTPAGVRVAVDGVQYLGASDGGDGRVTLERAMLPRVRTWQAAGTHGDLPDLEGCFEAYVELLKTGTTGKLAGIGAGTRGAGDGVAARAGTALVALRATRGGGGEPPETADAVFRTGGDTPPPDGNATLPGRLEVRLVNGDLRLLAGPLMLGHYRSFELTGAEAVADRLLGDLMGNALKTGAYPTAIGAVQVFGNHHRRPDDPSLLPRPSAVVVVGLGEEGELNLTQLCDTVRQGVLVYAQRVAEQRDAGTGFDLSATLMGSGGSSMPVATSAHAIAMAVQQANRRLAAVGWPQVRTLQIVDRYLDRASEALQALRALSDTLAQDLVVAPQIRRAAGALRRPPEAGYRGVDYDFVAVAQEDEWSPLQFTLDTRRARSEVNAVSTQSALVRKLIEQGAFNGSGRDTQTGRSLFKLMVPLEIEPFLAESTQVVLQLDHFSAQYPWELLDTAPPEERAAGDRRPWALRSRLLRKLRTPDYRETPRYAGQNGAVLVIGEPQCDLSRYGSLPAAEREARQVVAAFSDAAGRGGRAYNLIPLLHGDAAAVTNAALGDNYRIIHVAGHGDFQTVRRRDGDVRIGGVVLSDGMFFGPDEVRAMRRVPDLVFINCCHVGRMEDEALKARAAFTRSTPVFAASVAEALIDIGVRCVVAAGWAVGDAPAAAFAQRFYKELLDGEPFVEAVTRAREDIWIRYPDSNTWAAYQCYGDPGWRLMEGTRPAGGKATPPVASAEGLLLRLQGHAQELQHGDDASRARTRAELTALDTAYGETWREIGEVCTAFGAAYGEDFQTRLAIEWYERARVASDGSGSIKALQQLGNLKARDGEKGGNLEAIEQAIALLDNAFALAPTPEGASLLGSAWKRRAMVEENIAGKYNTPRSVQALQRAREYYADAEQRARAAGADDLFYPLSNRIALDVRLGHPATDADLDAARAWYDVKLGRDPDFWSAVGRHVELQLFKAVGQGDVAGSCEVLLEEIRSLRLHTSSQRLWNSVASQAGFLLKPYLARPSLSEEERAAVGSVLAAMGAEVPPTRTPPVPAPAPAAPARRRAPAKVAGKAPAPRGKTPGKPRKAG
ncbi:MAG: CHAT domain-containing protein [Rubrivivax sp.]|nr:MAG: CHAT domain-containing protein [Rubrivivax sp.]